jgi:hypothetical protein
MPKSALTFSDGFGERYVGHLPSPVISGTAVTSH